jgi:hypothetical protein
VGRIIVEDAFSWKRRFALAVTLLVAFACTLAQPVAAQQVTVIVGGQPLYLNPGPIERAGRVFVPLRGIFERLGASVVYQAGTINATKGRTTVSLQIGSTQATVDGQPQYLDVAPFIVGATTYVPLRFVAQSLGANVNYDSSTRVVSITGGHAPPPPAPYPPPRPVRPNPPPPPPAPAPVHLSGPQPGPGSQTGNRFVTISSEFSRQVRAASVRVWLDGSNITSQCGISPSGFSYKPPAPLYFGSHTVRVTGESFGGAAFDRSWTFTVIRSGPPPPSMHLTINQPAQNVAVGRNFVIRGNTVANARVRVTAGATPSSTGQFAGTTEAGPRGNFSINVSLQTLLGQQSVKVTITATDPQTSQSTQTVLQLRLNQ